MPFANSGGCCRRNLQYKTQPTPCQMQPCRLLREKLTVPDATTARWGEKICVFRCDHATTVAVYCQCYMQHRAAVVRKTYSSKCDHGPPWRENLCFQMQPRHHCSRILSVLYATTWPAVALKLAVPDATTGRSNDKTCSTKRNPRRAKCNPAGCCEKNLQLQV